MIRAFVPYITAALIAVGAFFTGAVTDIGSAAKVALDKEQAKIECAKLLDGAE